MDESNVLVKALELLNKNGVYHSSWIRPTAKLLVPKTKNQFRLLDGAESEYWNDYIMHGKKATIYDDNLNFRDTEAVFTLKGDSLAMITEYNFNKTDSLDFYFFG